MQLAAMPRPHAPPVPPRPSRQVVAEALKRARLPCPTRQAPPPPNVQPWQPDVANQPVKTNSFEYESILENNIINQWKRHQGSNSSNNVIRTLPTQKDAITPKISKVPRIEHHNNDEKMENRADNAASFNLTKTTMLLQKNEDDGNNDSPTIVVTDKFECNSNVNEDNNENIQHQDWLEAGIRYSSTKITLPGDDLTAEVVYSNKSTNKHASLYERIAMSSLQGLPPLPRSLSGFNLNEGRREICEPPPPPARSSSKTQKNTKTIQASTSRPSPPGRQLTTLDTQLAILRKEMFGLRQLDLSLLSQLWSLNESIQEFRQLLQDQEDRAPSPSPSSEDGDDVSYANHAPAPPRRPGTLYHHQHHHQPAQQQHYHHHHRLPRPIRPLRPLPNDESPSSEEYGAV